MSFSVERIIIKNRAPFESIDLNFGESNIAVLTATNGRGKTTILSHIADAWHEMVRRHFPQEFEGKENKFYRVSSAIYNLNQAQASFVYIRFRNSDRHVDYVDVRNNCSEQEYNEAIPLDEKIHYSLIKQQLEEQNFSKKVSAIWNKKNATSVFTNNVVTYFPSYRYEVPGYLNDPYKIQMDFTKESNFADYLPNPLEVVTGLPQLANWIMDVVLDMNLYKDNRNFNGQIIDLSAERIVLWTNLNKIIGQTLIASKKVNGNPRFGIGKRNAGVTRISIMCDKENNAGSYQLYPSIFNLSSGEAAVLCLFGEILRQADKTRHNMYTEAFSGIVLIDEVDKHLHIKLQKEVLPQLFNLFPKIQFIVSSHSPFLNMGLAEIVPTRAKIIDLDNGGITTDATTNDLYKEVYDMMISENEHFADMYYSLNEEIERDSKPLIITEGKTDVKHLKRALEQLAVEDCDVDFLEVPDKWGASQLQTFLNNYARVKQKRKIIGIFDRDEDEHLKFANPKSGVPTVTTIDTMSVLGGNSNHSEISAESFRRLGNNVFVFAIPSVNSNYGDKISIEHYYPKDILLKPNNAGKRLFLGEEFHKSGNSTDGKYQTKISNIQRKVEVNGVIDDKVFCSNDLEQIDNIAMSKDDFANYISDDQFTDGFDFASFRPIFDIIKQIIADTDESGRE